jgi:sulfopyruvate decarboxylase alpha subunit
LLEIHAAASIRLRDSGIKNSDYSNHIITIYDAFTGSQNGKQLNANPTPPPGQKDIFQAIKDAGVQQVAYVPDAGHSYVIKSAIADPEITDVALTTGEEGVAVAAGAWLGGQRAVLLMQSSGVGNCINMFSLLSAADIPFVTIVTMRGEYAEFNPWQAPMGRATQAAMELMGIHVMRVRRPEDAQEVVSAALDGAFMAGARIAVLIGQDVIGRKKWERK